MYDEVIDNLKEEVVKVEAIWEKITAEDELFSIFQARDLIQLAISALEQAQYITQY